MSTRYPPEVRLIDGHPNSSWVEWRDTLGMSHQKKFDETPAAIAFYNELIDKFIPTNAECKKISLAAWSKKYNKATLKKRLAKMFSSIIPKRKLKDKT